MRELVGWVFAKSSFVRLQEQSLFWPCGTFSYLASLPLSPNLNPNGTATFDRGLQKPESESQPSQESAESAESAESQEIQILISLVSSGSAGSAGSKYMYIHLVQGPRHQNTVHTT